MKDLINKLNNIPELPCLLDENFETKAQTVLNHLDDTLKVIDEINQRKGIK